MTKVKSFKNLFKLLSSKLLQLDNETSTTTTTSSSGSHRHFLRSRDLHTSMHIHLSASSMQLAATDGGSNGLSGIASPMDALPGQSDAELTHLREKLCLGFGKRKNKHGHHRLKRFFKILHPKDMHDHHVPHIEAPLPVAALKLHEKYSVGRLIGLGASGSVNIVTRKPELGHLDVAPAPGEVLALKKFRAKLPSELTADYARKVRNEFLVGEHLRQQNLIHTFELFEENTGPQGLPEYYIVMEYCPFDFFNLVMLGLMRKHEIYCYFKQICHGVSFLHALGIAHRDLKLDNCVVDARGVLKLIDFGLAFQFQKEVDPAAATSLDVLLGDNQKLIYARGIVGLDPYLAPEVFQFVHAEGYDARLADVWLIAIILCCMILKRFPWKIPNYSDPSYRAYAGLNNQEKPVTEEEMLETMTDKLSLGNESVPKYGPERLLRILPKGSRALIGKMLSIDVAQRPFLPDVILDPFFQSIEYCHYLEELPVGEEPESATHKHHATLLPTVQPAIPEVPVLRLLLTLVQLVIEAPHPTLETPGAGASPELPEQAGPDASTPHTERRVSQSSSKIAFARGKGHSHHLVTEDEINKIKAEKEKVKRTQQMGMA